MTAAIIEKLNEVIDYQNNDHLIIDVVGHINSIVGMAQQLADGKSNDSAEYLLAVINEDAQRATGSVLQLRLGYKATEDNLRELGLALKEAAK